MRWIDRTRGRGVGTVLALTLGVLLTHGSAVAGQAHNLELGGGMRIPFDGDLRTVFGSSLMGSLAYSTAINPAGTRVFIEVGYSRGSGQLVTSFDPTFKVPESERWLVPIALGIMTNPFPKGSQSSVGIGLGAGFMNMLTGFTDHNGESYTGPAFGIFADLRPEVRISNRWNVWVRQRITLVTDVNYGRGVGEFNYSGTSIMLGLRYRLNAP